MDTATSTPTITITALPAIGADLVGGTFFGITTGKDGIHYAATLLPAKSEKRLTWKKAMDWAVKQGGMLPSRTVAALLFANLKEPLEPTWHWTSDEDDASCAWFCGFGNGLQNNLHKSYEGSGVAVRLIPLTA